MAGLWVQVVSGHISAEGLWASISGLWELGQGCSPQLPPQEDPVAPSKMVCSSLKWREISGQVAIHSGSSSIWSTPAIPLSFLSHKQMSSHLPLTLSLPHSLTQPHSQPAHTMFCFLPILKIGLLIWCWVVWVFCMFWILLFGAVVCKYILPVR